MAAKGRSIAVLGVGFLGAPLCRVLSDRGYDVLAFNRSGVWPVERGGGPKPDRVRIDAFDFLDHPPQALRDRVAEADSFVACYASAGGDRRRTFVAGAEIVTRALTPLPLTRVVYTSSTSALPDVHGRVDESEDRWPTSDRGRIQREAEDIYLRAFERAEVPLLILRLAGLYGPGRPLGRIYAQRTDPLSGDGHTATNLVHRDDALACLQCALDLDAEHRGIVHVCDDDHRSRRSMYAAVAARRGGTPPRWEREADDAPPRGKVVDNTRMKSWLQPVLHHPTHSIDE